MTGSRTPIEVRDVGGREVNVVVDATPRPSRLFRFILLMLLGLHVLLLAEIGTHARLAAVALATMALDPGPPPARSAPHRPGIQPASLQAQAPAPEAPSNPRFEAGSVDLPDHRTVIVVKDNAARTVTYILGAQLSSVYVPPDPEPSTCEDEDLEDSGLREVARTKGTR